MRHSDGYTPPRLIRRPIWPRVYAFAVVLAVWGLVYLLYLSVRSVISMLK